MNTTLVVKLSDLEKLSDLNDIRRKFEKENAGSVTILSVSGHFDRAKIVDFKTQKKTVLPDGYDAKHFELGVVKTVWMVGQNDSNQTILLNAAEQTSNVAFTLTALPA